MPRPEIQAILEMRWTFLLHQCRCEYHDNTTFNTAAWYALLKYPITPPSWLTNHLLGRLALPKPTSPNGTLCRRISSATALYQTHDTRHVKPQRNLETPTPPSEVRDPSDPVAQDWAFFHHQRSILSKYGSSQPDFYKPHTLISNPPRPQDITLELLLASQCHIGHATSLWHPSNARYIFGIRQQGPGDRIHIISLDTTASHLRRACKIVRGVASRGGLILFVGTREGQARIVVRAAELSKGCHLFTRWAPGSITNRQQILGNCQKIVVDENDEPVPGFADQLPDTSALTPDLVVCLNPVENYVLLQECGAHNIPTIGIVDTDANPNWVTYPIPANDDSLRSTQVICGALGRAGEEGQAIRRAKAKRGAVVSMPSHGLQPPKEGQVEKELEQQRLELERRQEEDELWAQIAKEVPGGVKAKERAKQLEIDESALESFDAVAGPEIEPALRNRDGDEMVEGEAIAEFDAPLNQGAVGEDVPYERDRPLTQEELAQAPPATNDGLDDFGGELDAKDEQPEYFGGIRDEQDPK